MNRTRCRIRRLLFPPIIFTCLLTLLFIIIVHHSFLRDGFYYSSVNAKYSIPGSYMMNWTPNYSYCNFKYGLPDEFFYEESDVEFTPELKNKSHFRVIYDVIKGMRTKNSLANVTYATHVTVDFVNYLAEIVRYWDGPVSVAAFVPDSDAHLTIKQLSQLCHCIPEMSKVSVHFVFPLESPPYLENNPLYNLPLNCQITDSSKLSTFRSYNDIIYPVNVCRNVARNASTTYYVMVSDVQLIPSEELAPKFMKMIEFIGLKKNQVPSLVYVVPIFEIENSEVIPRTKEDLVMLVKQEKAVYFHRYTCSHCQKFPGIQIWLKTNPRGVIKPFLSVKREFPYYRWEPIFIGSKDEPLYAESLSWEGMQDKMSQMLEMCLIGYNYIILDGAFLVHWPGIKKKYYYPLDVLWRSHHKMSNSRQYDEIVEQLARKYKHNPKCQLH